MSDKSRAEEGGFTLVELLVAVIIAGGIAAVLGSAFFVGSKTTIEANARLEESSDAQLLTNYFRADAASAAYFSKTTPPPGCGLPSGASPVANFGWTSYVNPTAPVQQSALYYRPSSSSTSLFRRYCEGSTTKHEVEVVESLSSTMPPVVTCLPLTDCNKALSPSQVVLEVTEASNSYTYKVQGTNRTDPASGSPLLGNVSIYVGGNLSMNSQTKVVVNNGGVAYVNNVDKCNDSDKSKPKAEVIADVMYTSATGGCGSDGEVDFFDDPLLGKVTAPLQPKIGGLQSGTCKGKPAWTEGYYKDEATFDGVCLKAGTYYFDGDVSFNDVVTEGGVLLYVNKGNVNFDGINTLASKADGDAPGFALFMRRDHPGTITIQTSSSEKTTIDGIIYAAAGTLEVKNNNSILGLIDAVVVGNLLLSGNSDVTVN